MAGHLYPSFLVKSWNKEIDLDSDDCRVMLTSGYTFDAAHDYKDDVTGEVTATGYTAGGAAVTLGTAYTAADDLPATRADSTAYVRSEIVRPSTGNGFVYQALTDGTTGSSAPTYPTTLGGTVTDGGVTWLCAGAGVVSITMTGTAQWTGTISADGLMFYDAETGADATSPLICHVDLESPVESTNDTWTYTPDAAGLVVIPVEG